MGLVSYLSGVKAEDEKPAAAPDPLPSKILVIDIGGTKAKLLVAGETEPRKFASGKAFTPKMLVDGVRELTGDWDFEAVSIGYPGMVGASGPRAEPGNLGGGWVGFDFAAAFGRPVRIINDAVMQALGSYEGGRMLFIGLGTGLGSTLIADNVIVPLELGQLIHPRGQTYGQILGRKGLESVGKVMWRQSVHEAIGALMAAFMVDHMVIGGGNAKRLHEQELPHGARLGNNLTAFRGGQRLWKLEDVPTLSLEEKPKVPRLAPNEWRLI